MEKKLSVLLLDDEPLILQSLRQIVDWEALGCAVTGTAENGREGLELIAAQEPDIVITDIVMPEANGLEIAAFCRKLKRTRVILISAYSDFSFAQEAMAYGVRQYILKPIDSEKLREAVAVTANEIRAEREHAQNIASRNEANEGARLLAFSSLLFRIACYGQALNEEEEELLSQMSPLESGFMAAARFFNIPADDEGSRRVMRQTRTQIEERFSDTGILWGNSGDQLLMMFLRDRQKDPEEWRNGIIRRFVKWLDEGPAEGETVVSVGVSDLFSDPSFLHPRYLQCTKRARDGFFADRSGVIVRDRADSLRTYEADPLLLRHHMRHGNAEEMRAEADRWREYVMHLASEEEAMDATREMYRNIMASASKIGMTNRPRVIGSRTLRSETAPRLIANLCGFMEEVARYARESQDTVGRIRIILEEKYTDSSFSLSALADELGLNASYVSRLFKKEIGENFSSWLTARRLKQSCFLLETTATRVRDIAAQVGFEDEHYFSMVFKREKGMTPTQYREARG